MSVEVHRKQYWVIFVWLAVLTVLEVGIVLVDISRMAMIGGLIGMALAKAVLVGHFYMHLGHETPMLRRTVWACLGIPVFYACVLIAEGMWRMLG